MSESPLDPAAVLRVSDLVPLRRMLGTDSVVLRVHPDGDLEPFERMPTLFFERSIRRLLDDDLGEAFHTACDEAIAGGHAIVFRAPDSAEQIRLNPILDDDTDECRFLVCWVRNADVVNAAVGGPVWGDLRLDDIITRYRRRSDEESAVVDAAPWWALPDGELLELWPHHPHVSAVGLGHAVMQALITDAAEAAVDIGGGPAVRVVVPSADMLAGLVPVFHGVVRASGIEPRRMIVAIDVALAVDDDLLAIIVHLRTIGMQIDIVGLDALTRTLHTVSDTSRHAPLPAAAVVVEAGPWAASLIEALEAAG